MLKFPNLYGTSGTGKWLPRGPRRGRGARSVAGVPVHRPQRKLFLSASASDLSFISFVTIDGLSIRPDDFYRGFGCMGDKAKIHRHENGQGSVVGSGSELPLLTSLRPPGVGQVVVTQRRSSKRRLIRLRRWTTIRTGLYRSPSRRSARLTCGNGSSGTLRPRKRHSCSQPSPSVRR